MSGAGCADKYIYLYISMPNLARAHTPTAIDVVFCAEEDSLSYEHLITGFGLLSFSRRANNSSSQHQSYIPKYCILQHCLFHLRVLRAWYAFLSRGIYRFDPALSPVYVNPLSSSVPLSIFPGGIIHDPLPFPDRTVKERFSTGTGVYCWGPIGW